MSFRALAFGSPAKREDLGRSSHFGIKRLYENAPVETALYPERSLALTGTAVATGVKLEWPKVPGATFYQVLKGTTTTYSAAKLVNTIDEGDRSGLRSYTDVVDHGSDLPLYYWVRALNETGEGPISNREDFT